MKNGRRSCLGFVIFPRHANICPRRFHSNAMNNQHPILTGFILAVLSLDASAADAPKPAAPKPTVQEEPLAPGGKWRVHDTSRPRPAVVDPGTTGTPDKPGQPPSDAIVLFDGKDLSHWQREMRKNDPDKSDAPKWKIVRGWLEVVPRAGVIYTREKFGDCQIHVEWAVPADVKGEGQARGNSGIFPLGFGEIQVLDSYENDTYADGQTAALYGKYPPLVNAARKPGEWQAYDIIIETAKLNEKGEVIRPALMTLFHNGVLVHHAVELNGRQTEGAIGLQDHLSPVRYRNIWVRKLKGYDAEGK